METNLTEKEVLIGLYLVACIILLLCEPTSESIMAFIGYYVFVIANLWNAARLADKYDKQKNGKSDITND